MDTIKRILDMEHLVDAAGITQPLEGRLRFGEAAVAVGYVKDLDVRAALAVQRLEATSGKPHRLVGEILVDQGRLTRLQVSRVLDAMVVTARRQRTRLTNGRRLGWSPDLLGPLVA